MGSRFSRAKKSLSNLSETEKGDPAESTQNAETFNTGKGEDCPFIDAVDFRGAMDKSASLDECVKQRRLNRQKFIAFLMENSLISIRDICQRITEYLWLDEMLIPNTNDKEEFMKYWNIIPNGSLINNFRAVHAVNIWVLRKDVVDGTIPCRELYGGSFSQNSQDDVHSDHEDEEIVTVSLFRRGGLGSVHEYVPSKKAKLKIECSFQWQSDGDFMTFTTRSNGQRDSETGHRTWGGVDYGGHKGKAMRVVQCQSWGPSRIEIQINGDCKVVQCPPAPKYETVTVEIVDDGESVEMTYRVGKETYFIRKKEKCSNVPSHHIALFNREQEHCIVDISSLTVSVLIDEEWAESEDNE